MRISSRNWVKKVKRLVTSRQFVQGAGIFLAVFILLNAVVGLAYKNKLYPRSSLAGQVVGGKSLTDIQKLSYLPESIKLKSKDKQETVSLQSLGAKVNWPATTENIKQSKNWLPLVNLLHSHRLSLKIDYDQAALDKVVAKAQKDFALKVTDWTVVKEAGKPKLVNGIDGHSVKTDELSDLIIKSVTTTAKPVAVPLQTIKPSITDQQLKPVVDQLTKKQKVKLVYGYNGRSRQATAAEILGWYDISGAKFSLATTRVSDFVANVGQGFGIRVKNLSQVVSDTATSLDKQTVLNSSLVAAPKAIKQYTFCVRAKGVSETELPAFAAKIASTLNDSRGWSLDGLVSFSQANSGCDMVAWLAAAKYVPSFGAICDSTWSCTVRPNVIINYDRWRYASDAWNASHGSLSDYRSMVINHEGGHWLGFGHRFCAGPGKKAPVMQQQSISLQGCKFNPWPTTAEKDTLKANLGL